jgi:hypothetical protein
MNEKSQRNLSVTLWVLTSLILALITLQGLSGNWITYFLILPGGPANLGQALIQGLVMLAAYHRIMGFIIGLISVLVLVFAFVCRSGSYVRLFAVLGFIITILAAAGGFLFMKSGLEDRWPLGQMSDAFVGALAAYFLQLYFMNKVPGLRLTSGK